MARKFEGYTNIGGTKTFRLSRQRVQQNQQTVQNDINQAETTKGMQESANDPYKQAYPSTNIANNKSNTQKPTYNLSQSSAFEANLRSLSNSRSLTEANLYRLSSPQQPSFGIPQKTGLPGFATQYSMNNIGAPKISPVSPFFSNMGAGVINNQQAVEAARSAGRDKLVDALNNLGKKLEETSKGGGGGDGGFVEFLQNLGKKDRLGFRGGIAGQLFQTGGKLINSGIDAYLNYQNQMATAPVETYSNIAQLKGFQQRRFLRDFSDFSPEAMVLRNKNLRFEQTDITSRIDKIAKETTQKQDIAETQSVIKHSLGDVLKSVVQGAVMGAGTGLAIGAVTGPGALATAGVGALTGGVAALAGEFAGSFNNPALMRNQKVFGDLYLKNRTAFDTQNIIQNTQSMENAVLQNSQIDIGVQEQYQKTLGSRIAGAEQGRYFDVYAQERRNAALYGYNTPQTPAYPGAYTADQSTQMRQMAANLYTRGEEPKSFAQVLTRMGRAIGTQEAESVMQMLSNVGGAGAGPLRAENYKSLETVRQLTASGRGPAEQLLGQAGLLGRLSGGVSVDQNLRKLEEVLGRAVATGMDNSELGSAFVQNVANMSTKMQSGDVGAIAELVQKMQSAGGGQLVDYQRVQQSMSDFDRQRQQNLGVKTMSRENIFTMLKGMKGLSSEDVLAAAGTMTDMTSEEVETLTPTMEKYLSAKTDKEKAKAYAGLSKSGKDLALKFKNAPDKLRLLTDQKAVRGIKNAFGAGALVKSVEGYKQFSQGYEPVDIKNASDEIQQKVLREADKYAGGRASQYRDVENVAGADKPSTASARDKKASAEYNKKMEQLVQKASAWGAQSLGAKNEDVFATKFQSFFLKNAFVAKPKDEQEKLLNSDEYKALLQSSGISEKEGRQLPGILNTLQGRDEKAKKKIDKDILGKLFDTTTAATQRPQDVTSVSDKPQGSVMSTQDAALLGEAFANAFFKVAGGKNVPSNTGTIPKTSLDKSSGYTAPASGGSYSPGEILNLAIDAVK